MSKESCFTRTLFILDIILLFRRSTVFAVKCFQYRNSFSDVSKAKASTRCPTVSQLIILILYKTGTFIVLLYF